MVTPSGLSSVGGGLETPGEIELRKKKEIEDAMETGGETPALFHVLNEKRTAVGASMMGSAHTYELGLQTPKKAFYLFKVVTQSFRRSVSQKTDGGQRLFGKLWDIFPHAAGSMPLLMVFLLFP